MFKATLISTFFAVTAFQAVAEPGNTYDRSLLPTDIAARVDRLQQYGNRFEHAIEATLAEWSQPAKAGTDIDYDLSILPADVAARVVELQRHGDRFAPVIRAIFVEAKKPNWAFEGCSHEGAGITLTMIQG